MKTTINLCKDYTGLLEINCKQMEGLEIGTTKATFA